MAGNVCNAQSISDLQLRARVVSALSSSMLDLKEELRRLLDNDVLHVSRQYLFLANQPDIADMISRLSQTSREILKILSPVHGPASVHLESIQRIVDRTRTYVDALDGLRMSLQNLHGDNSDDLVMFAQEIHWLLTEMEDLNLGNRSEADFDSAIKNFSVHLSDACELKDKVVAAERAILTWRHNQKYFTMDFFTQFVLDITENIQNISDMRASVARAAQMMESRFVIESHFDSIAKIAKMIETFDQNIQNADVALSAIAPAGTLMNLEDTVSEILRDVHAFYGETLPLTCRLSGNITCTNSDVSILFQSYSLQQAQESLLERLGRAITVTGNGRG